MDHENRPQFWFCYQTPDKPLWRNYSELSFREKTLPHWSLPVKGNMGPNTRVIAIFNFKKKNFGGRLVFFQSSSCENNFLNFSHRAKPQPEK